MTKIQMRDKALTNINGAISRTRNMDWKSSGLDSYWHAMAQGIIMSAFDLELINQEEYDQYWNQNNEALQDKKLHRVIEGIGA